MSYPPRITLRLLQVESSDTSVSSCHSISHGSVSRGLLLPLPPTLNALKQAAMDAAHSNQQLQQKMKNAKLKRKNMRMHQREDSSTQKRSKHNTIRGAEDAHMMDEKEKEKEEEKELQPMDDDSEDESNGASLPDGFPFVWKFYIDGGEIRSSDTYSALVRDRDCVDAEVFLRAPSGTSLLPLEAFLTTKQSSSPSMPLTSTAVPNTLPANDQPQRMDVEQRVVSPLTAVPRQSNPAALPVRVSHDNDAKVQPVAAPVAQQATAVGATPPPTQSVVTCSTRGCNRPATIGPCPHCVAKNEHRMFFCSQDCFRNNYAVHSALMHPETV